MSEPLKEKGTADQVPTTERLKDLVEGLSTKLDVISLKIEKRELQEGAGGQEKKTWWTTLTQILGIPAIVVAILLQVAQTTQTGSDTVKTEAEAAKLRAEELKTRAELEILLDEIAAKKEKGIAEYRKEIERTLPKLEATIGRLNQVASLAPPPTEQHVFSRYVILWAAFIGISLIFDIISQIWSTLLASTFAIVYQISRKKERKEVVERRERLRRIVQHAAPFLTPLPNIIRWAVTVSLFLAVVVPFFDSVAGELGSGVRFANIAESVGNLDFAEAISKLREIIR